VADIKQLVSRLSSGNVMVLCALKYHCTPEDIEERMEVILARAMQNLKDRWRPFRKTAVTQFPGMTRVKPRTL
jgi:hypothetical protein